MPRLTRVALVAVGLAALGWLVILVTAVALPGGHPPLVAYVAVPVLLGTTAMNVVGLGVAAYAWRRQGAHRAGLIAILGNATFLLVAAWIFLRR